MYLEGEDTFSELCESFEISRKTGYKWVKRYEEYGVNGLQDRSRAPLSHPQLVSEEVVRLILNARLKHPRWGPKKLLVIISRQFPRVALPAASTVGEILRRNEMTRPRKRIRRSVPNREKLRTFDGPNRIWCADYKGHFPVDGKRCHPLTISDGYSRFLLRCQALRSPLFSVTKKQFELTFREFGLPDAIRTDNGPPFSSLAPAGLSQLSVWWIRLGIYPERIKPGRPDQNGRHERMHGTLKAETARPPHSSFRAQQSAFDYFREEYNHERPHEALDQEVPAAWYKPSERQFPARLPEIEYPEHFHVQHVYPNGVLSFSGVQFYISGTLANESIGLEELGNDRWKAYFGDLPLGILDLRSAKERGYRRFATLLSTDRETYERYRQRRPN